jgi:hypothetical protein
MAVRRESTTGEANKVRASAGPSVDESCCSFDSKAILLVGPTLLRVFEAVMEASSSDEDVSSAKTTATSDGRRGTGAEVGVRAGDKVFCLDGGVDAGGVLRGNVSLCV